VENDPICVFKTGPILDPRESLTYFYNLNRLKAVKHRNIVLKILHGDIYTRERLHRFGLIDSPTCSRCDEIDTVEHKFATCEYINRIWIEVFRRTENPAPNLDLLSERLIVTDRITLMLNAEILYRINSLRSDQEYLILPKIFVLNAIRYLIKMERSIEIKTELENLLQVD
jgi:hypothetical protein